MSSLDLFGAMYGSDGSGFYHKIPCENYTEDWKGSMQQIGKSGWNEFQHLFFHPEGDLYGVVEDTKQLVKAPPPSNPSTEQSEWRKAATVVSSDMGNFKFLFFDPDGNLYGVKGENLYTGPLPLNPQEPWLDSAKPVGANTWSSFNFLFFDNKGFLYGLHFENGTLHQRIPPVDKNDDWLKTSKVIGTNWRKFRFLFFMSNGELYGVQYGDDDDLYRGSPPTHGMPLDDWFASSKLIAKGGFNVFQFMISPLKVIPLFCKTKQS